MKYWNHMAPSPLKEEDGMFGENQPHICIFTHILVFVQFGEEELFLARSVSVSNKK